MVELELDLIPQTFLIMNLLIHDFLHDFDLKNSGNVSRLKRSQKIFSQLISALPTEGGGMKGGAGEIHYFLRWVSGSEMRAPRSTRSAAWGLAAYDMELEHSAEFTLDIFERLLPGDLAERFEAHTPFLDDDVLQYIILLTHRRALRSRGDIIKKIRLVFNLVNDIILYTVGFLNTLEGNFFEEALLVRYDYESQQQGGIDPTRIGSPGSPGSPLGSSLGVVSPGSPGSPSKSQESLLGSQGSPGSPSKSQESLLGSQGRPLESNKTKKLTQQQKYNNYVSSFISAIDIFKFKASKEIEDEDNKKAYEIFLTNFGDVFKLVTQRYNTVDPFKILNSLDFKKILVVFLMVGENTDKSEILKGFLNNSLHSEKEKKINVSELIKKYKLKEEPKPQESKPKESKPKEPKPKEPKPKESKVNKLIEFFEKKNIQKGGAIEQDLEEQNNNNWEMFITINNYMDNLIHTLNETLQNSRQSLERLRERDDGMIDVFVESTPDTINDNISFIIGEIRNFIRSVYGWHQRWSEALDKKGDSDKKMDQVINLETTIRVLESMNQDLSHARADLETLFAQNMEIFSSPRQQARAAVDRTNQFQDSFENIIDILNTFESENIGQLRRIKDTYLSQIEINTNRNNRYLQRIRSADLSPEEILLGNKINRSYVIGMFIYLNLLDINYESDGGTLFFTDRMNHIIHSMKSYPNNKYCKLLALEFFILFKNRYTSDKLWSDFNNMTHKKFDWSQYTRELGSGLDTQLINGVKIILEQDGIEYYLPEITSAGTSTKNIINNAYTGLENFHVSQENNVLCPYASIVDAMPQCSYSENSRWLDGGRLVEQDMDFTIRDRDGYYTYFGKIERQQPLRPAEQAAVNYTMLVTSPTDTINVNLQNINLETSTILQANSVYANLLQHILEEMTVYLSGVPQDPRELAVYVNHFWSRLATSEIFKNLARIGMRKGAGDFFQEVFATFNNNGGSEPNIVPHGIIYGLMGDRPSGVRCIFFNLLGRDGIPGINQNNISGYGTMGMEHNVIISADPELDQELLLHRGGGFKKTRRNKRKRNKKTRRNKRKRNKNTRRNKRKRNKNTRRNKKPRINKKTRRNKRKYN